MIIVYLSLVLVVCTIVWFIFSFVYMTRQFGRTLERLAAVFERMRKRAEKLSAEKQKFNDTLSAMQLGFVCNQEKWQRTSRQVQQFVNLTKSDVYKVKQAFKQD
ncbi:MAG: hypothetical protein ABF868_05505 [Sporolactobacillus sp.]